MLRLHRAAYAKQAIQNKLMENITSASTAMTCRRSATGNGARRESAKQSSGSA